jgi:hypothetical protein
VFGVNYGPAEALDKLCCGVIVIEMIGTDKLVKQYRAVRAFALLRRHDDSGHTPSLGFAAVRPPMNRVSTQIDGPQTGNLVTLDNRSSTRIVERGEVCVAGEEKRPCRSEPEDDYD